MSLITPVADLLSICDLLGLEPGTPISKIISTGEFYNFTLKLPTFNTIHQLWKIKTQRLSQ